MNLINADILKYIFSFLEEEDCAVARFVCRRWKSCIPAPLEVTCIDYIKYPHVLRWARSHGCPKDVNGDWSDTTMTRVMEANDLPTLQWMCDHGGVKPQMWIEHTLTGGFPLEVLEVIVSRAYPDCPDIRSTSPAVLLDWMRSKVSCSSFVVETIMRYMHTQNDKRIIQVIRWVVDSRVETWPIRMSIMLRIYEKHSLDDFIEATRLLFAAPNEFELESSDMIAYAAQFGRKDIIDWLLSQGVAWNDNGTYWFLAKGHFELAKWSLKQYGIGNFDDDLFTISLGSRSPQILDMLNWLYKEKYPLPAANNPRTLGLIVSHYSYPLSINIITWLLERGASMDLSVDAHKADIMTLRWLHSNGYTLSYDEETLCRRDNLHVLQFMLEQNMNVPLEWYRVVAYEGRLDLIKVMYARGYPIQDKIAVMAISAVYGEQIEILDWMHSQGFTLPYKEMEERARHSSLPQMVRWIRKHS